MARELRQLSAVAEYISARFPNTTDAAKSLLDAAALAGGAYGLMVVLAWVEWA